MLLHHVARQENNSVTLSNSTNWNAPKDPFLPPYNYNLTYFCSMVSKFGEIINSYSFLTAYSQRVSLLLPTIIWLRSDMFSFDGFKLLRVCFFSRFVLPVRIGYHSQIVLKMIWKILWVAQLGTFFKNSAFLHVFWKQTRKCEGQTISISLVRILWQNYGL